MRNVIKFNGRLYAMLEEGCHTIQGEIVHVIPSQERSQVPETNLPHRWVYAMGKYYCQACGVEGSCNGAVSQVPKFICDCCKEEVQSMICHECYMKEWPKPDSRECCNCEYHLTKKANDEVIVRDEMLLKMREGFQMILDRRNMKADDYYAKYPEYRKSIINDASPYGGEYQTAKYFLALPLPATTLRLEAERKVIEAAHKAVEHINLLRPEYRELNDAIAHLDSLGGGK